MNQRVLVNIGQLVLLNILYIITMVLSVGILIIPATSTLFLFIKAIGEKKHDPYSVFQTYFRTLINQTKKMGSLSFIMVIIIVVCLINLSNINFFNYSPFIKNIVYYTWLIIIIELVLTMIVSSFLIAYFDFSSKKDLLKMSFYLIHRHIIHTIIVLILLLVFGYLIVGISYFLILCMFSILFYLIDKLYLPLCSKYIVKREV
ncbi:DUF624 domain-containing protein [Haploplasma modicum]|uniref:DUF624 domain-containing protein n=1 Tax=Haploplasma modicum TaxID=2150 RepID=UPI00047DAF49|nr:DUF624 domain-containing protein [Haploplasma modicum]